MRLYWLGDWFCQKTLLFPKVGNVEHAHARVHIKSKYLVIHDDNYVGSTYRILKLRRYN